MKKSPNKIIANEDSKKLLQSSHLPAAGVRAAFKGGTGRHLFKDIGLLCTMRGAAEKKGRDIEPADLSLIPNAAIVTLDGVLEWVGAEKELPQEFNSLRDAKPFIGNEYNGDSGVTSFSGATVIPGLIECHTHLIYGGHRAGEFERRLRGESYQSIAQGGGGILATVLPTRAATQAELLAIGQTRADRFLCQGVTTLEAKSGYGLTVESELKLLRAAGDVRGPRIIRTFLGAHAVPKEFANADDYLDVLIREALPVIQAEGLAQRVDIFIEKGFFSAEQGRRYLEVAKNLGFNLAVHADQITLCGGADLAVDMQAQSAEHLIKIGPAEVRRLAESEVTCVLLPTADLYMACDYPPARALLDQGGRVALATDLNPGTAPSLDIALAGLLARLKMSMTWPEVMCAYTVSAAHALGMASEIGALTVGRVCDFCVLDGHLDELFLEAGRMPILAVYRSAQKML